MEILHSEDFVNEDIVSFDIDGKKFKYKPTTSAEENEWMKEYMVKVVDGDKIRYEQDLSKVNKCKVRNIRSIPYLKDEDWLKMSLSERWEFIGKLKPKMFDKLITKIIEIDSSDSELKKNWLMQ